jgi:pyrroline-5-carboxylate reductase
MGAGHLGEAVLARLLDAGHPHDRLRATTGTPARARTLAERYGVDVGCDNQAAAQDADVLVLTVRPEQAAAVLARTVPLLTPGSAVLSFVAGLPLGTIAEHDIRASGARRVHCFRAATNTASVERGGLLAVSAEAEVPVAARARAEAVLAALGEVTAIPEDQQDTAAATLGSGAAFLALAASGLGAAASGAGVADPVARAFAADALESAAALLRAAEKTESAWSGLATPGGITEAGLARLARAGTAAELTDAVHAAVRRAAELRSGRPS